VPLPGKHIVIAGAGIIGLATALELAQAGAHVTVLDRGHAMQQSSWAAAGMLAVDDPENDPALHPLAVYSRSLYPAFLARIQQLTGLTIPLRTSVTLQGHPGAGPPHPSLPDLRTDRYHFDRLSEASLDPRDLCIALPAAVRAAGIALIEDTGVEQVTREAGKLRVHPSNADSLHADHFLLAAGAWSAQIALPGGVTSDPALPIAPRKGQMIEVTLESPELPYALRTPQLYLVPRGDNRIAIGATIEHAGFDRSIDEAAGNRLWHAAAELWPPILHGHITARWTGLRPGFHAGIADPLPIIGPLGKNIWAATGHFRNGILLAPATALLLRQLIDGAPPSVSLDRFAPTRFA
jgi:glycine oxidase